MLLGDSSQRNGPAAARNRRRRRLGKGGLSLVEVLVLDAGHGLCFLDGRVHEVKLNLDEPLAGRLRRLLERNGGSVCIALDLDASGKGRVVAMG